MNDNELDTFVRREELDRFFHNLVALDKELDAKHKEWLAELYNAAVLAEHAKRVERGCFRDDS